MVIETDECVIHTERTEAEVARVEAWAVEAGSKSSRSRYPGMTYEEGIIDTLNWITGVTDKAPDEED
jgi:hypothetical protein